MEKMTQQHNSRDASNNWPQRLFNQSNGTHHRAFQKNHYTAKKKFALVSTDTLDWSKRLFATSSVEGMSGDKLSVIRDKQTLCELYITTSPAEVFIGNHPLADVKLQAPKVAKFHAKIFSQNGCYQLQDLGSERGTYLNGKKIPPHQPVEIQNGAVIRIMAYQINFEIQSAVCKVKQSSLMPDNQFGLIQPSQNSAVAALESKHPEMPGLMNNITSPQQWQKGTTKLVVVNIIDETRNVKTFRLAGISPLSFSFVPGQFVTLLLEIDGQQMQRSYSISSSPSRPCTLDLTVKRVAGGVVSNWLCDHVLPGDIIRTQGPVGRFSCINKRAEKYLFIGAGIGITPLMSMIRWLSDTANKADVKVLFSFRSYDDLIYAKELELLCTSNKTIDIAITLTGQQKTPGNYGDYYGRIDHSIINSFIPDIQEREIFVCGPDSFMDNMKSILEELDYSMERFHSESFDHVASPQKNPSCTTLSEAQPSQENLAGPFHTIIFAKSDKIVQVNENTNLLQLALSQGIEVNYDCRSGSCAECMIKCLSGIAEMDDTCEIDDIEREQGWLFSCCAYARSDLVINV